MEKINRAIESINSIVEVALTWMDGTETFIRIEFMKVFAGTDTELISHYLDKWDGDFARFYLNSDEGMKRKIFAYYDIPLEADKYPNSLSLNMAIIKGVPRNEILPFESYVVHLFYLMAYNNSLQLLKKISTEAFQQVQDNGINLYGNGRNWSQAWNILPDPEKEKIVEHILNS